MWNDKTPDHDILFKIPLVKKHRKNINILQMTLQWVYWALIQQFSDHVAG